MGPPATHIPEAVPAQVTMHTPCAAEQTAGALVHHAHHPIGPVVPAKTPEAARHVPYPTLHAVWQVE